MSSQQSLGGRSISQLTIVADLGNVAGGGATAAPSLHSPSIASRLSSAVRLAFAGSTPTGDRRNDDHNEAGQARMRLLNTGTSYDSDDDEVIISPKTTMVGRHPFTVVGAITRLMRHALTVACRAAAGARCSRRRQCRDRCPPISHCSTASDHLLTHTLLLKLLCPLSWLISLPASCTCFIGTFSVAPLITNHLPHVPTLQTATI